MASIPQIKIRLIFDAQNMKVGVEAQKGQGYSIDADGNIWRWQAIPEGEQGRIEFGLPVSADEAGDDFEFYGVRFAETEAAVWNEVVVLDSGGEFIQPTAFQSSHDGASGTLTLWEGPYVDQYLPIEGWIYQVAVLVDGQEVWLDPRIYNKGDIGSGNG